MDTPVTNKILQLIQEVHTRGALQGYVAVGRIVHQGLIREMAGMGVLAMPSHGSSLTLFGVELKTDLTLPPNEARYVPMGEECACGHLPEHHFMTPEYNRMRHQNRCAACKCEYYDPDNLNWLLKNRST